MAGQFKDKLQAALDTFDAKDAEQLLDDIYAAEESGYTLTATEDRLWVRLTTCLETYHRTSAAIDT
jgi:hypothetical protein